MKAMWVPYFSSRRSTRWRQLGMALALATMPVLAVQAQEWQRVEPVREWLGGAQPTERKIDIDLPLVVEDGSSVNLGITIAADANDPIRSMAIFAPANPTPEVASFELAPQANPVRLATRVRLSESQSVIVVARTESGRALISERAVRVTTSGCLAGAGAGAGSQEMQARVRAPQRFKAGESGEILTLISHPMHTGLAQDASGQTPPLRIVESFQASLDGQPLLTARFYRSLSANPYLRFYLAPEQGGEMTLSWIEMGGRQTTESLTLNVS
ncbi:MAG: thiosulfate oxidation carrier protein SoxY [Pigmentiphaga sp.]